MRRYAVSKKDFESIFTHRELTFHERYMQTFLFVETSEVSYMLHQKLNALGVIFLLIVAIVSTVPLFVIEGLKGVGQLWGGALAHLGGEPVRKDYCYRGAESTEKLIKLAGWDK